MAFGLFKRKEKKKTQDSRYLTLKIKKVVPVSKDAVNVIFEQPGDHFHYQPGQFLTIIDEVGGKKIRRAYSLCTAPEIDKDPAVTVKRVPGGLMSNHINDQYKAGREVSVMEPMGLFTTSFDPTQSRKVVLIGGGSGITPLNSILKSILHKEANSEVTLIYANRDVESIIFKSELEELKNENPKFHLIHVLEEADKLADFTGRPDMEMVSQLMKKAGIDSQTEVFICGPQPMMDVFQAGLRAEGVEDSKIRIESFEAGVNPATENSTTSSDGNDAEVTIILNGESYSLTMDKNQHILAQALAKDLDMPYSCQSGLCTACRGKCLEGEVSVDGVMGLSDSELEEGYILTCVGKPLTDTVRIELG